MNAEQHHACLLRKERPDAVQAPTRLVGMHHQRAGQQRAQQVKLSLPIARQLIQQRVGLRLAEAEVLEEIEEMTDFVERQADDINQVSDLGDDLQAVLATAQYAGDLAVPVAGATIDLVRDEHRSTVYQAPHRPDMRQATGVRRDTLGENGRGSLSPRDFVVGGYATASSIGLALASFLAASLLSPFFRSSREGFVDLRRRRAVALFLEVFDASVQLANALVRGFKFTAQVHDQINEPFGADPPLSQILVERLDDIHTPSMLANPADLGEHRLHRMDSYPRRPSSRPLRVRPRGRWPVRLIFEFKPTTRHGNCHNKRYLNVKTIILC